MATFVKRHLKELLKASPTFVKGDYAQALKDAFIQIDEKLKTPDSKKELVEISKTVDKSSSLYKPDDDQLANGIGCTACVALITKTEIYVANSGDSRSVLCRKGIAIPMSEDHKPELERERKRIEKAGGTIEDGRVKGVLNLSRSLGDLEYKMDKKLTAGEQMITAMPEIKVEKITSDTEFLIIGCDGIWDCLTNEKAVATFREKTWSTATNKPIKTKLGKVIGDVLDVILAKDLDNPGTVLHID